MAKKQINVSKWQDYRGKGQAVLVYLNTTSYASLPLRDIIDEHEKGEQLDPNYETGTYNFYQCSNSKLIASAFKNKRSYLFFGTSYQGQNESYTKKYLIIGYLRLQKFLDVRKRHMHKWMEQQESASPACVDLKECYGLYSDQMNFYKLEDCFELNEEVMKSWGYSGRVAKHMKLTFSDESTAAILEHFNSRQNANNEYIEAVDQLIANKQSILDEIARKQEEEDELW